jgi:hypothetical protein
MNTEAFIFSRKRKNKSKKKKIVHAKIMRKIEFFWGSRKSLQK